MPKPAEPKPRKPRPNRARQASSELPALVPIAVVAKAHGLQGEIRVHVFNPESDLLERLATVLLALPDGTEREVELESVRYAPGAVLITLPGVETREQAEALRGAELRAPRAAFDQPEKGEFYICDLERCAVLLGGQSIGSVERVLSYPTCDVLVVARADGSRIEVPLHEDFVAQVRIEDRVVELSSIEGLE